VDRLHDARLRYTKARRDWSLYGSDRKSNFHRYDLQPAADVVALLDEVDRDPTSIFWG
jgi:hypothetical protein